MHYQLRKITPEKNEKQQPRFRYSRKTAGAWELFSINNNLVSFFSFILCVFMTSETVRKRIIKRKIYSFSFPWIQFSDVGDVGVKRKAKTILRVVFNLHLARNIAICVAGSNQTGNLFALLKSLLNRKQKPKNFLSTCKQSEKLIRGIKIKRKRRNKVLWTITIYDIKTMFSQNYISSRSSRLSMKVFVPIRPFVRLSLETHFSVAVKSFT